MTEELPQLMGFEIEPSAGGPPDSLVVLAHGYGADGQDMIGLAEAWAPVMPKSWFMAPNAPEECPGPFGGFRWFDMGAGEPGARGEGTRRAAAILNAFIDRQLAHVGLDDSRLIMVGFSQGAPVTLEAALRRKRSCLALLTFTGSLANRGRLEHEIAARPPALLINGDADERVPVRSVLEAVDLMDGLGVPVTAYFCKGLGHAISEEGVIIGGRFLVAALNGDFDPVRRDP